jgi:hypothetical protein
LWFNLIIIYNINNEVILDSKDKDNRIAVIFILLTPLFYSTWDLITIISNSAWLNKRLRVTKGNNIILATARFNSLESSAKASSNKEVKGWWKLYIKVIENEFKGYIKRE